MARYIDVDKVELKGLAVFDENLDVLVPLSVVRKALQMTPTADVVPKSEVAKLQSEVTTLLNDFAAVTLKYEKAKAEVARTFRKRMNEKMGKHTHLLCKEYVQRIMREVEKELIGEEDA